MSKAMYMYIKIKLRDCIAQKGGAKITEHVLFAKYVLCKKLGAGRSGTVYLAYHKELEEYRAVKIVPKTIADYETFKKEALFIKSLRHPGIPLVYDVDEDEESCYLFLELVRGESVYNLTKRLGSLSVKAAVNLGIQICRIIQFLNTAEPPILYLDLQPKNLLVSDGEVCLVDFDHAQYAKDVEDFGERYGTIGFAAPEQYEGAPLDCRTDVYAIGALLYFMCRGRPPGQEPEFGEEPKFWEIDRIIRGCMAQDKEDRYPDAKAVEEALREWNDSFLNKYAIESLKIVFAGAKAGIGTTHAALGLSTFLTRNGCPTLYQESYETDTVRDLVRNLNAKSDGAGVYHFGRLNVRPFYGKSVKMPYHFYPNIVYDMGISWLRGQEMPEADLYVLVCGSKLWEIDSTLQAARKLKSHGHLILLWNHASDGALCKLPDDLKSLVCLKLPYFSDPFKRNNLADACFSSLLERGTGENDIWNKKRRRKFFRRRKND